MEKRRTQNVNESFHHTVWQYAPKDKVNSVNEINLALRFAVLVFNEGHGLSISAICKSVGIQFSQNMLDQLYEIDSTRLYEKHRQLTEICKQRRKYVKCKKVKSSDAFTHDAGPAEGVFMWCGVNPRSGF